MKLFKEIFQESPLYNDQKGQFSHTSHGYLQRVLAARFLNKNKHILIVLPNLYEAQKYYDNISSLIGDEHVLFYPADQVLTSLMALGSPEFKNERLFTLRKLLENKQKYIIVTTQDGLLRKTLSLKDYENSVEIITTGCEVDMEGLIRKLQFDGYQYNYTVERPGEYAVRGSIVDIFTHHNKDPYRLDFFDNLVETIKTFDVVTQKSIETIDAIEIIPLNELFFTDQQKETAIQAIKKHFKEKALSYKEQQKLTVDLENLEQRKRMDGLHIYIEFFNPIEMTIIHFLDQYECFLIDPFKIALNEETMKNDLKTYETTIGGNAFTSLKFRAHYEEIKKKRHFEIDIYQSESMDTMPLGVSEIEPLYGDLPGLLIYLNQYQEYTVILGMASEVNYHRVKQFLTEHKIDFMQNGFKKGNIHLIKDEATGSFLDHKNQMIYLTEDVIFQTKHRSRIRYRSVINQAVKIRDSKELEAGDFVVHYDFGIGKYIGLKTMSLSGVKRDYLHIVYDNDEALYVPTDQIDLVLKYRAHDGIPPKLSKLSGKQWSKKKAQVRKRIKELSDRLLSLYAARNQIKGFKFSKDNELLTQFEQDFNYEETPDQRKAIEDVKRDMESDQPMDRLIAGDVGFGKTEVALRAAFKAVLDGKQVAYLVPTTVLARQHYYTFKERFEKFGGTVELLSRFVARSKQKETLDKLKKGFVDVVVGTHRLLSLDVAFKDLGLFIIDEEQRFGVEHKEKIKEMKLNVDTLTLSATPIPRTLQMAMYGLKDLSMIETPPLNRYPVQTYVIERQAAIIKEAIDRELSRGGQVFYLYNRVETIEVVVQKIKDLVPHAKVSFAHGKLNKNQLEDVLSRFIDKEFDVLVSTTIIETGVDIPNTNTLIVHEADKLGLAQLYQLRGRVGRSDRIAYAYLMYDGYQDINDEAKKRLSVIEDFTDLGSGFKIALRDLSIRGAGDILGQEQSGFIDSVGIELYMKLLDEVMKGQMEDEAKSDVVDQVFASRHIPQEYIESDPVRIEIHKRIATLNTTEEVEDLKLELIDRFGAIDVDVLTYMYEKLFKRLGHLIGIEKTTQQKDKVQMIITQEKSNFVDGLALLQAAQLVKTPIQLGNSRGKIEISMTTSGFVEHWLYLAAAFLQTYFKIKSEPKKSLESKGS